MYPFATFPENVVAFGVVLRHQYGFRLGLRQIHNALRALEVASIADERAVRNLWRPILSSSADEAKLFDRAFDAFFLRQGGVRDELERPVDRDADAASAIPHTRRQPERERDHLIGDTGTEAEPADSAVDVEDVGETEVEQEGILRSSYSPIAGEAPPPELGPADRAWQDAALAFVRRVRTALSRRWKPAARGSRFDLRRTLRSSLHTGGEPLQPRWRARPRLRPRFVMILDGSRSMSPYADAALRSAVAIAMATTNVEAFVFSTELQRITPAIRRAASGRSIRLPHLEHAWGGGTGIGTCLRDFIHRYGERLLGRDAVTIIVSDGLDIGDPVMLRQAMTELRRRSAAVIWLNPLLDTPGYEPTATGMRTARPSITTLASIGDVSSLYHLARTARVN
jgi:uncharacterized protein with von Willebrand factor type A (vWA) domain